MQTATFSYNTGPFFSGPARVIGWALTLWGLLTLLISPSPLVMLLPVGFVTHFTHYRTEFDLQGRLYREGFRFAGMTFGKMLPLAGVDFLYLNRNRYSQLAESRASSTLFRFEKYDGYIMLADNTKLHLVQERSKEKALQQMERISDDLGIELRDHTGLR